MIDDESFYFKNSGKKFVPLIESNDLIDVCTHAKGYQLLQSIAK